MWLNLGSGGCLDIEAGVPWDCAFYLYLYGVFIGACAMNFLEGQRADSVLFAKSCNELCDTEACLLTG